MALSTAPNDAQTGRDGAANATATKKNMKTLTVGMEAQRNEWLN